MGSSEEGKDGLPAGAGRRRHHWHPLRTVVWACVGACVLGILAVIALAANPAGGGAPLRAHVGGEAYTFDNLAVNRPYLNIIADHGYLVPFYAGDDVAGVVLLARGKYVFQPPWPYDERFEEQIGYRFIEDDFTSAILPASYQQVEQMRYRSRATAVSDRAVMDEAEDLLQNDAPEVAVPLPFGLSRVVSFRPLAFSAYIHGLRYGDVRYSEGPEITLTLITLGRQDVSFPNASGEFGNRYLAFAAQPARLPVSVAVFGGNLLLLFVLAYLMTADLERFAPRRTLRAEPLAAVAAVAAVAAGAWRARVAAALRRAVLRVTEPAPLTAVLLGLETLFWAAAQVYRLDPLWAYGLYAAFDIIILLAWWRRRWPAEALGLTRHHFWRSALTGAAVGCTGAVALTLAFPRGLAMTPAEAAVQLFVSLAGAGLLKTLYLQGLVQTSLQRLCGPVMGLALAALLAGLVPGLPAFLARPGALTVAIQAVIVTPLGAALLGYIYWRTGNIAGSGAARGLLDALPRILRF
jgi:uncharacterized membrane protein